MSAVGRDRTLLRNAAIIIVVVKIRPEDHIHYPGATGGNRTLVRHTAMPLQRQRTRTTGFGYRITGLYPNGGVGTCNSFDEDITRCGTGQVAVNIHISAIDRNGTAYRDICIDFDIRRTPGLTQGQCTDPVPILVDGKPGCVHQLTKGSIAGLKREGACTIDIGTRGTYIEGCRLPPDYDVACSRIDRQVIQIQRTASIGIFIRVDHNIPACTADGATSGIGSRETSIGIDGDIRSRAGRYVDSAPKRKHIAIESSCSAQRNSCTHGDGLFAIGIDDEGIRGTAGNGRADGDISSLNGQGPAAEIGDQF